MTPVRLEPAALRSRVKHSTTEPLRSLYFGLQNHLRDIHPCILANPKGGTLTNSEDQDEMPQTATSHQGPSGTDHDVHNYLGISTCEPLKYIMDNHISTIRGNPSE